MKSKCKSSREKGRTAPAADDRFHDADSEHPGQVGEREGGRGMGEKDGVKSVGRGAR